MWSPLFCLLLIIHVTHFVSSTSSTTTQISIEDDSQECLDESQISWVGGNETNPRAVTYPCQCALAQCGCCTGNILQNFNLNIRQRLCMNMTYDPDDFAIGMKLFFNDRVLYNTKLSGKNPPPVCVPIPRITAIKFCVRLTNVYFIGRNVHACVVIEAQWNKETAFAMNFDCIRLGSDGVSVVKPEEGGGLPHPVNPDTEDNIEEYDELLENQSTKPPKPNKSPKPPKPTKLSSTTPVPASGQQ